MEPDYYLTETPRGKSIIMTGGNDKNRPHRKIQKFLHRNKILTLCASGNQDVWAANCFFKFNAEDTSIWISTNKDTRHSIIMSNNNIVAGTIYSGSISIFAKKGLQYRGRVHMLSDDISYTARQLYLKKFPFLKHRVQSFWEIKLDELKFTDMTLGKAAKFMWSRL